MREFFELDRLVKWVLDGRYRRVALQFPDSQLPHAFDVACTLEQMANPMTESVVKFYILADTSYRNCCIDYVAAEHAACDALVHFGDCCLTSTTAMGNERENRVPVLHIFCQAPLDLAHFEAELSTAVNGLENNTVALLFDSAYINSADILANTVMRSLPAKIHLVVFRPVSSRSSHDAMEEEESAGLNNLVMGRVVTAEHLTFPNPQQPATLLFVGARSSPLLNIWLMTFPHFTEVVHYSPTRRTMQRYESNSMRQLRRRLFLMEKLRDAHTVGLVVATLSTEGFRDAIRRIRELCTTAGKKLYVFSVGKINEAKLSNFGADIDAFILLSCPYGILMEQSQFFKPILSVFEAELALDPIRRVFFDGDTQWSAELNPLHPPPKTAEAGERLQQPEDGMEVEEREKGARDDDADGIEFSLVSGKLRALQIKGNKDGAADANTGQLVEYSAGDYFAERSWKGLDDSMQSKEGDRNTNVQEGLKGIAAAYESER